MKKLTAIILSTMLLDTIFCMDVPNLVSREITQLTTLITKEDVIQARDDFTNRDETWKILNICDAAYEQAKSQETSIEESIEHWKVAFCGPAELVIRAYIDQEEQRFIEILDQNLDKSLRPLKAVCSQQDIDFGFILNLGICKDSASSLGYKFLQFEDIQKKKRAIFWLLVAATGYNTSMPSHCIISAGDLLNRLRGI